VDYETLKDRLLKAGQVLDFTVDPLPAPHGIPPKSLPGIVLDDGEATFQGFESTSQASAGFVGAGYRHDDNSGKGAMSARFTPNLPKAGSYQIGIAWPVAGNRATKVPVIIRHSKGESSVLLNQRLRPQGKGPFHILGTFEFAAGREGWVEIRNTGTDGHVVVDAVQWLPVE
jgi:hypothetical protein